MPNSRRIDSYLMFFILASATVTASNLMVVLDYDNLSMVQSYTYDGPKLAKAHEESDLKYFIYAIDGTILEEGYISLPEPRTHIIEEGTEITEPMPNRILITFRYPPSVERIEVYNKTALVFQASLMEHNRCNLDNICDENENRLTCPEDCHMSEKDGICHQVEDGICTYDPDCEEPDPDCVVIQYLEQIETANIGEYLQDNSFTPGKEKSSGNYGKLFIFLIILALVVGALLYTKIKS
jgi:hypothetical protein